MGSGELSAHLILWLLRSVPAESVVLIEEPETFLAPHSQVALVNVLARIAARRAVSVIFSTHSEAILRRIPIKSVRLISRIGGGVQVDMISSRADYLRAIGMPIVPTCIALVEDRVAQTIAKAIVARVAPHLLTDVCFEIVRDGESAIFRLLDSWPIEITHQRLIGVLDGDQRKRVKSEYGNCALCIPGELAPEAVLLEWAKTKTESFAKAARVEESKLRRALATVAGADVHDALQNLATELGLEISTLIDSLVTDWLADEKMREQCYQFAARLQKLRESV